MEDKKIWNSNISFEQLDDLQKKAYNTILELILEDQIHKELSGLLNEIASRLPEGLEKEEYKQLAQDYTLELDLKWDNFGFRENQLVLIDHANTRIESGVASPKRCRNTESICSGPHRQPNQSITQSFRNREIADSDENDPSYQALQKAKKLLEDLNDLSNQFNEFELHEIKEKLKIIIKEIKN